MRLSRGPLIFLTLFLTPFLTSVSADESVPYLISIQTPKIKEAWRQVSELIQQNDRSPNPLPDPYLARAEIWTNVGSHEDAVEDYLPSIAFMSGL